MRDKIEEERKRLEKEFWNALSPFEGGKFRAPNVALAHTISVEWRAILSLQAVPQPMVQSDRWR